MALFPIIISRTTKPPLGTPIDWSNPLAQGLVGAWAFNEGAGTIAFDAAGINNGVLSGTVAKLRSNGYYNDGTNAGGKCTVKTGSILGGLSSSTVLAIINTTAAIITASTPETSIGSSGNAIFCERASSGDDIYKLGVADPASGESVSNLAVEFTYRNDGGTLLQRRMTATTLNNGADHVVGLTKAGTSHQVYFDGIAGPNTTAYGSSSVAFTDANINTVIGNDIADVNAAWNGYIKLVLIYNRALSPAEIASLSANPWQIYEPEIMWVEVGSGATGVTSSADHDDLTITGSTAAGYRGLISSATAGGLTATCSAATSVKGFFSVAESGAIATTGADATGTRNLISTTATDSATISGVNSTDCIGYKSIAATGSVSTTGTDSTGVYTPVGSTTSTAQPGLLTVLGVNASGLRSLISAAEYDMLSVLGVDAYSMKFSGSSCRLYIKAGGVWRG